MRVFDGELPFWGCPHDLGIPSEFVVDTLSTGVNDIPIGARRELLARVPLDMIVDGLSITAIDEDGTLTRALRVAIRTDKTSDWIYTNPRGEPVPASLVGSFGTKPFQWPAPRVVMKGETIQISIINDGSGVTGKILKYVQFSFQARRLVQPEAERYLCLDQAFWGYQMLVCPPFNIAQISPAEQGRFGPQVSANLTIDSLGFDFLASDMTVLLTNPNNASGFTSIPVAGALAGITYLSPEERAWLNLDLVSSARYGGVLDSTEEGYRPVSGPLPACYRITDTSNMEFRAAFLRTPAGGPTTFRVYIAIHGQRIPVPMQGGAPCTNIRTPWPTGQILSPPSRVFDPRNGFRR